MIHIVYELDTINSFRRFTCQRRQSERQHFLDIKTYSLDIKGVFVP